MRGAVKKFELMEPVEISMEQAKAIAEFVYDTNFTLPDWYKKHYREEHGKDPEQ